VDSDHAHRANPYPAVSNKPIPSLSGVVNPSLIPPSGTGNHVKDSSTGSGLTTRESDNSTKTAGPHNSDVLSKQY
jgi:hypothetical protein